MFLLPVLLFLSSTIYRNNCAKQHRIYQANQRAGFNVSVPDCNLTISNMSTPDCNLTISNMSTPDCNLTISNMSIPDCNLTVSNMSTPDCNSTVNATYDERAGFNVSIPDCNLIVHMKLNTTDCEWMGERCFISCSDDMLEFDIREGLCVNPTQDCQSLFMQGEKGTNLTCSVSPCVYTANELLGQIEEQEGDLEDLKKLLNFKKQCLDLFGNLTFVEFYNRVEKGVIHRIMKETAVGETAVQYDMVDIAMTVASAKCCAQDGFIELSSPQNVPGYDTMKALIPMEAVGHNTQDQQKAAVVHYKSPQQFLVRQDVELSSAVVRVEVLGEPQALLRPRLRMAFTSNKDIDNVTQENKTFSCQFYNESGMQNGTDRWSSGGCHVINNQTSVECECDHMTPFAVLLIPGLEETLGHHWTILSYISYIGCGLSAFFCFITILTYFILRKVCKDPGPAIHCSLAGALLLLNSSFLLSQWASDNEVLCVCVAVAIEVGLLSSFSWMAIEALHLYLLLVRVFNTYIRRYLLKLSLIGWGVPVLLVTVSLVVKVGDTPVYGLITTSEDTRYCWITDDVFAYGMNVTFFSLVFILNFGVLVTVSSRILRRSHRPCTTPGVSCKDLLTVLSLTCLLGSTWGLAFLSMGYTNIPILYLFCILNSLQGFFLFLWVYRKSRRDRREQAGSSGVIDSFSSSKTVEEFFPAAKRS